MNYFQILVTGNSNQIRGYLCNTCSTRVRDIYRIKYSQWNRNAWTVHLLLGTRHVYFLYMIRAILFRTLAFCSVWKHIWSFLLCVGTCCCVWWANTTFLHLRHGHHIMCVGNSAFSILACHVFWSKMNTCLRLRTCNIVPYRRQVCQTSHHGNVCVCEPCATCICSYSNMFSVNSSYSLNTENLLDQGSTVI